MTQTLHRAFLDRQSFSNNFRFRYAIDEMKGKLLNQLNQLINICRGQKLIWGFRQQSTQEYFGGIDRKTGRKAAAQTE